MHLNSPNPGISQIRAAHTLSEKSALVGLGAPAWQASIWYSLWVEGNRCHVCILCLAPAVGTVSSPAQAFFFPQPRAFTYIWWPGFCCCCPEDASWSPGSAGSVEGDYSIYWIKNWHKESSKMKKEREYVPTKRTGKKTPVKQIKRTRKKTPIKQINLPPKDFKVMIIKMLTRKSSLAVQNSHFHLWPQVQSWSGN